MKMPEKINSASTAATTDKKMPTRRRSSSPITPAMVAAPNTAVRNPTPTQNNRSVRHQPVINPVATTDVAHPLTMLTADAATAVASLGGLSCPGIRTGAGLMMPVADSSTSGGSRLLRLPPNDARAGVVAQRLGNRPRRVATNDAGAGVVGLRNGFAGFPEDSRLLARRFVLWFVGG